MKKYKITKEQVLELADLGYENKLKQWFPDVFEVKLEESEEELWLPVHNYLGFYEVSNMGNVRSLSREVKHSKNPEFTRKVYGKVLSKSLNPQGYYKVGLSMYGIDKTHLVYHLVSEVFLNHTNRSKFICVDHIDEDKTNDKASNLQIISKQENTKKSFDYKLDTFNIGDYWFHNTGCLVLIFEVTKYHGGTIKCKHIKNDSENFAFHAIGTMDRKATEQEVFEALKNEAVKRGFGKKNVYFIDCLSRNFISTGKFSFYNSKVENNGITNGANGWIFRDGIWATIIPTLTKKEAEEKLNCKII